MRNPRFAAPGLDSHANRFVVLLKGIVLTAALIAFVLLMQATWSAAKSAWLLQPQNAEPALTTPKPTGFDQPTGALSIDDSIAARTRSGR